MKPFLAALFVLFALDGAAYALTVQFTWTAPTADAEGNPLTQSTAIFEYRIYRCQQASCNKTNGVLFATIAAPSTTYVVPVALLPNLAPASYFVTAVNAGGESGPSATVRVVPPDIPKNYQFEATP